MIRNLMLGAVAAVAVGFSVQTAQAGPPVVLQPGTGGFQPQIQFPRTQFQFPQPQIQFPRTQPAFPRTQPGFPIFPQFPVAPAHHNDHEYVVYVGRPHRGHIDWERYGCYDTRCEAERVERFLERRGLPARIKVIHNHH